MTPCTRCGALLRLGESTCPGCGVDLVVEAARTTPTLLQVVGVLSLGVDGLLVETLVIEPGPRSRHRFLYDVVRPLYELAGAWPFVVVGVFGAVCFWIGRRQRKIRDREYLAEAGK